MLDYVLYEKFLWKFQISRHPDLLCEKLITLFYQILTKDENVCCFKLTNFIYLLGEVALKQFVYLDSTVYKELKRRNNIRNKKEKDKKKKNSRQSAVMGNNRLNEVSLYLIIIF